MATVTFRIVDPETNATLMEFDSREDADRLAMGYLMDYSSTTPQLVLERRGGRFKKWEKLGLWERPDREKLPMFRSSG